MSSLSVPYDVSFAVRLRAKIRECGTSLCVGIDPALSGLPPFFAGERERLGPQGYLETYSNALIDAAAGRVPAVKFQSAYFEAEGPEGFMALKLSLRRARDKRLLTILDAKRGDIASTMEAYGAMAFKVMEADSLTVSPYLGLDVIDPLVPWLKAGKGAYVVWVSSNPTGAVLQEAKLQSGEWVATHLLQALNDYARERGVELGYVLGATKVDKLDAPTLAALGNNALLMPGVGAQGGVVTARIRDLMARSGTVLIPMSRGVAELPTKCGSWAEYQDNVTARLNALISRDTGVIDAEADGPRL